MSGHELSYAVRFRVIARYIGHLCLVLAILTVVPFGVSLVARDLHFAWRAAVSTALLAAAGALLARVRGTPNIQRNEAAAIVVAGFLIAPIAMAFPFTASGLDAVDALFEAVSGITTTGLTVVNSTSSMPASFLFARAWMQWYGGLGVVVLSLALVTRPGTQAHRISAVEDSSETLRDIVGNTRAHARRMWIIYVLMTGAGFLAMVLSGTRLFPAIVHSLAAVSTGGFSTSDRSLMGLPSPATRWVALALGLAGAVPLAIYYRLLRQRDWRSFVFDPEVIAITGAVVVVGVLLTLCLRGLQGAPWSQAFGGGFSTALSSQSTTGFSTLSIADLPPVAKGLLVVSMFTGGCLGSTAGAVKWLRLLLLFKAVSLLVARSSVPRHAVLELRLRGDRIEPGEISDAALVFVLFLVTNMATWLIFLAAGQPALDSLFDVVSATGTVGLSTGVTGSSLPTGLKLLLCADMWLGRLEIVAFLVVLYPYNWLGQRRNSL